MRYQRSTNSRPLDGEVSLTVKVIGMLPAVSIDGVLTLETGMTRSTKVVHSDVAGMDSQLPPLSRLRTAKRYRPSP